MSIDQILDNIFDFVDNIMPGIIGFFSGFVITTKKNVTDYANYYRKNSKIVKMFYLLFVIVRNFYLRLLRVNGLKSSGNSFCQWINPISINKIPFKTFYCNHLLIIEKIIIIKVKFLSFRRVLNECSR